MMTPGRSINHGSAVDKLRDVIEMAVFFLPPEEVSRIQGCIVGENTMFSYTKGSN